MFEIRLNRIYLDAYLHHNAKTLPEQMNNAIKICREYSVQGMTRLKYVL